MAAAMPDLEMGQQTRAESSELPVQSQSHVQGKEVDAMDLMAAKVRGSGSRLHPSREPPEEERRAWEECRAYAHGAVARLEETAEELKGKGKGHVKGKGKGEEFAQQVWQAVDASLVRAVRMVEERDLNPGEEWMQLWSTFSDDFVRTMDGEGCEGREELS